jgi:molybdopterin synthase sulfur carrier subunit
LRKSFSINLFTFQGVGFGINFLSMNITVKFFAVGREIVGSDALVLTLPDGATAESLLWYLKETYPQFQTLKSLLIAVNEDYAEPHSTLHETDDVAVIPPVSGG